MPLFDANIFGSQPALGGTPGALAQLASSENRVPVGRNNEVASNWWQFTDAKSEARYPIDATRWNKLYPYQLLVLEQSGHEHSEYTVVPEWQFTLPFPPESISISMPFAQDVRATLEGIVEESSGAPFRIISFNGTTGLQPLRQSGVQSPFGAGDRTVNLQPGFIPIGTVSAVASLVDTATRFIPSTNLMSPTQTNSDGIGSIGRGSGYYQFRLLQLFLERYADIKTKADGKSLRLALAIWKDQAIYLITPNVFDVTKSVGQGPLTYNYRFTAKAWRRVSLKGGVAAIPPSILSGGGIEGLPAFLEALTTYRDSLVKLKGVLRAVRADIEFTLFEPLREIVALAKDAAGVPLTLADLPAQIVSDMKSGVKASLKDKESITALLKANGTDLASRFRPRGEGAIDSGKNQQQQSLESKGRDPSASPESKLFDDPLAAFEVFAQLEARRVRMSPNTVQLVANEVARLRKFKRRDFVERLERIQEVAIGFNDTVGAGSASFNSTYNRTAPSTRRTPSEEDFQAGWILNDVVSVLNKITLTNDSSDTKLDAIQYVAGLARSSGIAFQTPNAKFAVPFPYGGSLEWLASLYLKDPDRWHEIATLNGLRSPFVDEVGFELPLLANGNGNTVVVSSDKDLFVGQPVTIASNNAVGTKRRILSLGKTPNGMVHVVVDGEPDMGSYTKIGAAYLHAYLPDTVNSTQQIYIPSSENVDEDFVNRNVPGVASFQTILDRGGVDVALTSTGDLFIGPDGDTPWAVGMANLLQRVKILFGTRKGSVLRHPELGLQVPVGSSTADLDATAMLEASRNVIAQDPDFSGVYFAQVDKKGPVVQQIYHVGVAGVDQLIPVGLEVTR